MQYSRPKLQTPAEVRREFGDGPNLHRQIAMTFATRVRASDPNNVSGRDCYTGPFHTPLGDINGTLIERELAEPGSVLPDDFRSAAQVRWDEAKAAEDAAAEQKAAAEAEAVQATKDAQADRIATRERTEEEVEAAIVQSIETGQRIVSYIAREAKCSEDLVWEYAKARDVQLFWNAAEYEQSLPNSEAPSVSQAVHANFVAAMEN